MIRAAAANCLLDPPEAVASCAGADALVDWPTGIFRVKLASESWERHQYARLRHQGEQQRIDGDPGREDAGD